MKPKLFISYSHKDKEFALKLSYGLKEQGADVFIDKWEIKVGDYFLDKILEAIKGSNFIVTILSNNSVKSEWVLYEIKEGKKLEQSYKKTLILPIKIDDCLVPEVLVDKSYADFAANYSEAFNELLLAVGGKKPKIQDCESNIKSILLAKTVDGESNLLNCIYDVSLDVENNWLHKKIVDNIILQIAHDDNQFGISLDIDTGRLIDRIPLLFKNVDQLIQSLQNIPVIIKKGSDMIRKYYNLPDDATFATDPIFRTLVIEWEARIKTGFRTILPMGTVDIDSGKRKAQVLKFKTTDELLGYMKVLTSLKKALPIIQKLYKLEDVPIRPIVQAMGVEDWFFPTAGYNLI